VVGPGAADETGAGAGAGCAAWVGHTNAGLAKVVGPGAADETGAGAGAGCAAWVGHTNAGLAKVVGPGAAAAGLAWVGHTNAGLADEVVVADASAGCCWAGHWNLTWTGGAACFGTKGFVPAALEGLKGVNGFEAPEEFKPVGVTLENGLLPLLFHEYVAVVGEGLAAVVLGGDTNELAPQVTLFCCAFAGVPNELKP